MRSSFDCARVVPIARAGTACSRASCRTAGDVGGGHDDPPLPLAEQQRGKRQGCPRGQVDVGAHDALSIPNAALGQRNRQATVAHIVCRADQAAMPGGEQRSRSGPVRRPRRMRADDLPRRRGSARGTRSRPILRSAPRAARSRHRRPRGTRCASRGDTESMSPTIPITGVGYTAPAGLSLYSETLPPVTGVPSARQASPIPAIASRSW